MFSKFDKALPGMMHIRLIKSFNELAESSCNHYKSANWRCLVNQGYYFIVYPDSNHSYKINCPDIDTQLSPRAFGAYISLLVLNHWAIKMYEIEDKRLAQFFRYHFHDTKRYLVDNCHALGIETFEANLVMRLVE